MTTVWRSARILILVLIVMLLSPGVGLAQQGEGTPPAEVDWLELAMGGIAGLVLFLYGVSRLSGALKKVGSDRARDWLAKAAGHRFRGLLSGTVATIALDSSSVTIILLITLVDAGLLSFVHAIPVILGSNIGTTISSQIFALDIDEYAPMLMLTGFLLHTLGRSETMKTYGTIALGIGLVLFGLHTIGTAAEPLEGNQQIIDWLKNFENPLYGVLAGAAATVAIQSSSAMMGIVITLAGEGLIGLPAGIAIMLGAEIGTCADTLLATLGRSRSAVRAGVFHLVFNIVTVALGVLFIDQITAFAQMWSSKVGQQIANAHVAFNVAGALLFIGFTPLAAAMLCRVISDRGEGATAPAAQVAG
jgi:phosphate:Na+ symporter